MLEGKKAKQLRVELRNESKLSQLQKSHRPFNERLEDQRKAIRFDSPFKINLKVDTKQPDSKKQVDNFEKEDLKILEHLKEVNWIKQKSVLDLSELIRKHMNKQPELLAMIQPDIKQNLLYNPLLMKTLDQLERADPINQRVKEIKQFITALKQDTFGVFN